MATPPVTDSRVAQTRVLSGRTSDALPRSGQNHMPVRSSVLPCGMDNGVNVTPSARAEPRARRSRKAGAGYVRQVMKFLKGVQRGASRSSAESDGAFAFDEQASLEV